MNVKKKNNNENKINTSSIINTEQSVLKANTINTVSKVLGPATTKPVEVKTTEKPVVERGKKNAEKPVKSTVIESSQAIPLPPLFPPKKETEKKANPPPQPKKPEPAPLSIPTKKNEPKSSTSPKSSSSFTSGLVPILQQTSGPNLKKRKSQIPITMPSVDNNPQRELHMVDTTNKSSDGPHLTSMLTSSQVMNDSDSDSDSDSDVNMDVDMNNEPKEPTKPDLMVDIDMKSLDSTSSSSEDEHMSVSSKKDNVSIHSSDKATIVYSFYHVVIQ